VEIQDADCLVTFDKFAMALKTVTSEPTENTGNFDYAPATGCFDKDLLTYPLFVRKWEKGDYFYPMGMVGKKKLAKFFKDEKYSLLQKENIWLLCSGEDIIWIIGKRLDDRFKISDKTKTILKATLKT
jgi:tRNA(Ile)-lysidine synthase